MLFYLKYFIFLSYDNQSGLTIHPVKNLAKQTRKQQQKAPHEARYCLYQLKRVSTVPSKCASNTGQLGEKIKILKCVTSGLFVRTLPQK